MADKRYHVNWISVEGDVKWNGDVVLEVKAGRTLRNGKYEEIALVVDSEAIDVYSLACARRTLRDLGDHSISRQRLETNRQEADLADS